MGKNTLYAFLFCSLSYTLSVSAHPFFTSRSPFLHITNSVKIENFSAISDGKKVMLNWKASPENKCDYFVIERAKDGTHFSTALIVKGAGHHITSLDYSDIDFAPMPGVSYYRIKQVDYEGHVLYSAAIPVNFHFGKDGSLVANSGKSPDDAEIKKIENKEVLVVLRDASGHEYTAKVKISKEKDDKLYATDPLKSLHNGNYTVVASSINILYSQHVTVR